MDFPERLRKLRKKRKLTQEELGAKINVTKVSISGYETGNRTPDTDTLQKLADFFEVTVDYLLGRSEHVEEAHVKYKTTVMDKEIELTKEEYEILQEIKKHPVMYHDLKSDPEKKVKQLIKMWRFIKEDLEEDDQNNDIIDD